MSPKRIAVLLALDIMLLFCIIVFQLANRSGNDVLETVQIVLGICVLIISVIVAVGFMKRRRSIPKS